MQRLFVVFLVSVIDVIDSPHTRCSTFATFPSAASPKPPIPKATLMETQTEEAKQDLSKSDQVWAFWRFLALPSINTFGRHVVNKVTNHSSCTHSLLLDLKLSETLSDDDTEQPMISAMSDPPPLPFTETLDLCGLFVSTTPHAFAFYNCLTNSHPRRAIPTHWGVPPSRPVRLTRGINSHLLETHSSYCQPGSLVHGELDDLNNELFM